MKTETTIDEKKEVLLNIISDAVVFNRFYSGISRLLYSGSFPGADIEEKYNGISTAFAILKVASCEEEDILTDIFLNYTDGKLEPRVAAEFILENWQKVLKLSN